MLLDIPTLDTEADGRATEPAAAKWGVDSEYGRLRDVMVSAAPHLDIVPCNAVALDAIDQGLACCTDTAERQHRMLVRALEGEGVRCHSVPPAPGMPDLSFTRDAAFMTPWGLLQLRPQAEHRSAEAAHVASAAQRWGVPMMGAVDEGHVEGGDICLLRPGLVAIGWSGERTDEVGARAVARLFEQRGWEALLYNFDPRFLHLDTQFCVVDRRRAVASLEVLDPAFVARLEALGLDLIPVSCEEVDRLGGNLLALGGGRVLSSADNGRVNQELKNLGYRVIAVDIDQFTRCGGGIHCLTMPLARDPG